MRALAEALVVTPVAVQGQAAPVGGRYLLFGDISVDSVRRVTFTASLSGGRVGIFRTNRDTVTPILLSGDDAPDDAGARFDIPLEAATNRRGDLAFISTVTPPERIGVFLLREGVISKVALEGDPAPTRGGEFFGSFDQISLLDSGEVYFSASLTDAPFSTVPRGRAVIRGTAAGLEAVIAPGDRFMGLRQIVETLQYQANAAGQVAALARIRDADLLQGEQTVTEMLLLSGGRLATLASVDLSISGGVDQVRNFAVTFNQVSVTSGGDAAFFAATTDFVQGAYYINRTGELFGNSRLVGQGDRSPLSPADRFGAFGAFRIDSAETLVFHATTTILPAGGIFARRAGSIIPVAQAGSLRPDGTDVWHGFLLVVMNDAGEFAFTDFQGRLVQVGVFLGRFVPPPTEAARRLIECLQTAGLSRVLTLSLTTQARTIERLILRGDEGAALAMAESLRIEISRRAGRSIPLAAADEFDAKLDDLILSLGGPRGPTFQRPEGRRLTPE